MGNRVKGRVKKKSIKAAISSSASTKQKLSRMGKKRQKGKAGLDATFITRGKCLRKLQVNIRDFRRLCILKGIYPREPRKKRPGNRSGGVFYHIKDVKALSHEPLLNKFRDFRTFMKKIRRSAGRNEKDEAARKQGFAPTYTLNHLVKERYPRFVDALSDVDDALTLVHLFAALPSVKRIRSKITKKAKALSAAWGAYCATTSSITKSFISVKGIYFEADIQGSPVRWIVPHAYTQNLPTDVDFRVMLTFFEFYEVLLGFVLFKLYNDIGIRFPLPVSTADQSAASSILAANLVALQREAQNVSGSVTNVVQKAVDTETKDGDSSATEEKSKKAREDKSTALLKSLGDALNNLGVEEDDEDDDDNDENEDEELDEDGLDDEDEDDEEDEGGKVDIATPLKAALENMAQEEEATGGLNLGTLNEDAIKRKRLFSGLTFFISREVPRGYLELVCLSYGARVGWDGEDSPVSVRDPSITHHIVDRPELPSSFDSLPKSREYIQPQWLLDCANFHVLLPCSRYGLGAELPPHLSPWVNDEEEGYKPAYAEEIERYKSGTIDVEQFNRGSSDVVETAPEMEDSDEDEDDDDDDKEKEEEEEEEEEEGTAEAKAKNEQKKKEEEDETKQLARSMMSKKASRLYGRMQHGIAQRKAKVDELHRRRQQIEGKEKSKDGKTILKQKVERLKRERREIEAQYGDTGGSMKRRKNKRSETNS